MNVPESGLVEMGRSEMPSRSGEDQAPDVLESITDAFQLIDREARFVRFNPAAREIFAAHGVNVDELIGRCAFDVFPDISNTEHGRALRLALQGKGSSFETQYAPWRSWFTVRHHPMPGGGVATFFVDITLRKESEYALRDSEELYRALVEVSPQTVWYGRADGHITFVNHHWLTYTGMSMEESLGDGWANAIDPVHRKRILGAWHEAAPSGRWELQVPFRRHDGEYRWHLARGLASRDDKGSVARWIGIAVDIHEQKQTEDALRRSEEKYRNLFDSMDEGYCVIDVLFDEAGRPNDWRFLEMNHAFNEQNPIEGMTVGKRMTELVPNIEQKWFDIYGRVALTGEPLRFTEDSDALNRWFDLYAFRVGGKDSRTVAVLFTNITQRVTAERALRESEERFRALATASRNVVWRMNADWSRARQVDGRELPADAHEASENWVETYIPPEDREMVAAAILRATHTKSIFQLEHRVQRIDGTIGWSYSRAVPLLGVNGEVREWFGMAGDITERKLAEEALHRTEKLAVVGRLAATISHEINNPLEAVTNLLYLIDRETDPGAIHDYAKTAQEELSRVSHIVTHTLRFNRQSTAATDERLSNLMESALAIYVGRLKVSEINLQRRYDAHDSVHCYASELRQVFTNLIGNAFDATRQGGTLTLRTRRRRNRRTGEDGVSVLIADTGHGMSAKTLERLFEAFFTTKGINGTGLGLWISKSILDKHRASLRVKSCDEVGGSGTALSIWLPRS